ncbi:hypothetical protein [Proteus sp. FME41]|uniref:hypothetical protein n=1 Tax=Proteus sp. FME41 TaxID=2742608 RepID=UPI0018691B52|nr:hypothetical protein [Proteus sp. FME41]
MSTSILLILSFFITNNLDEIPSKSGYYANSFTHQSQLYRCTVSPCPDPKDY